VTDLYWHHSLPEIDRARIEERAPQSLAPCLASPGPHADDRPLATLETVEVSFVDDATITQIHADHLADSTPTDVITFPHGEVFISLDTAAKVAPQHGQSATDETLLYLIHALLHLNGHHDSDPDERAAMHAVQNQILADLCGHGEQETTGWQRRSTPSKTATS